MFLAHLLVGIIVGLTASAVALLAGTSFLGASTVYALAGCIGTVASAGVAALPPSRGSIERAPAEPEMYAVE